MVVEAKENTCLEMKYFGRCRDDCPTLRSRLLEKLELFWLFLKYLDTNLKFTIEADGNELCFLDLTNRIQTTV